MLLLVRHLFLEAMHLFLVANIVTILYILIYLEIVLCTATCFRDAVFGTKASESSTVHARLTDFAMI